MLSRRHALGLLVAGTVGACTRIQEPAATPAQTIASVPTYPPALPPPPPTSGPPVAPAVAAPSAAPSAAPIRPTAAATATPGVASTDVALDVRLWNGQAEIQLDGRTITAGVQQVPRGAQALAALVEGDVVATVDVPPEGGRADLVVPPPLASLAIMIENQADARPQTGLVSADVVYEALAEGGITRFIALYLSGDAPVVGPVRSLRHYFAFFAADYGADVVHIGASPEGFAWRDAMDMGHLDESAGDPGVWRIGTRPPPHNAFTDTRADRQYLSAYGRQRSHSWGPILFAEGAPGGDEPAQDLSVSFGPWSYGVNYVWDEDRARYLRFMEGAPHRDAASGEQIAPATVVVQFADVERIPNDPKLRLDVNLVGATGRLLVFSAGTKRSGSWTKSEPSAPTEWLDATDAPLVIPPGPVWVEVVPAASPISWA